MAINETEVTPIRTDADKVTNRANLNDEMDYFAKHSGPNAGEVPVVDFDKVNDVGGPTPELVAGAPQKISLDNQKRARMLAYALIPAGVAVLGYFFFRSLSGGSTARQATGEAPSPVLSTRGLESPHSHGRPLKGSTRI